MMDMVPYILAGIPLAIVLRLGIYWLGERDRRRRLRADLREEWRLRRQRARTEHLQWQEGTRQEIDSCVARGLLSATDAENVKAGLVDLFPEVETEHR